jgi:hypothetical protein
VTLQGNTSSGVSSDGWLPFLAGGMSASTSSGHAVANAYRRYVPGAVVSRCSNVKPKLLDHLVSAAKQRERYREP